MKTLTLAVYASAVFLLATAAAGAYFQKSQLEEVKYAWLPAGFQNRTTPETQWGDLGGFNLVVKGTFNHTTSAPVIVYKDAPLSEQRLRTIASEVFGMEAPELEDLTPIWDISLREGSKIIQSKGQRVAYSTLSRGEAAEIEDWDQAKLRTISDQVISTLEPYWGLPTDAERRASFVGPTDWENDDRWINMFSVRYVWSVHGIDVPGFGCSVTLRHNYAVDSAIYNKPAVYVVGEQQVKVTPEEALATFIGGRSINSVIGAPRVRVYPRIQNGTVVVNDVCLVYYPLVSPEGEIIEALVYRIDFEILYEFEGRPNSVSAVEYEYAN